jgi:general secretion pathway protein C
LEKGLIVDLSATANTKTMKYLLYFMVTTVLVYCASTIFGLFIRGRLVDFVPPSLDEVQNVPSQEMKKRPFQDYKKIWERNLFSVTVDEERQVEKEDLLSKLDRLSLTSLSCSLVGTIINEGGKSWAIIKDEQNNMQDKYVVGSKIKNAKIVMILRNKVVLNINGKDELLVMGIEKIRSEQKKEGGKPGENGAQSTYRLSKAFVQNSMNNISQIMANVRIKPYFENSRPSGFRISRIKKGSVIKTMGFQAGDIIKSVNGQDILTAQDIMRVYGEFQESDSFKIGIVRGNQEMTLNFKVRE